MDDPIFRRKVTKTIRDKEFTFNELDLDALEVISDALADVAAKLDFEKVADGMNAKDIAKVLLSKESLHTVLTIVGESVGMSATELRKYLTLLTAGSFLKGFFEANPWEDISELFTVMTSLKL